LHHSAQSTFIRLKGQEKEYYCLLHVNHSYNSDRRDRDVVLTSPHSSQRIRLLITDWKTDMLIDSVRTRLFPARLLPARFAPALMFPRVICSTQVCSPTSVP